MLRSFLRPAGRAAIQAGCETIMEFASTRAMIQRKMRDAAQRRARD